MEELRKIGIIGLGLMGGSLSLTLQARGWKGKIVGFDASEEHCQQALSRGIAHEISSPDNWQECECIIIAIPIDAAERLIPIVLNNVSKGQVVVDMGSTKATLCTAIKDHPNRSRFVASHPMWGTEYSGPSAAINKAFEGKSVVLCDKELSDKDAVLMVESMYKFLGMHILYMNSNDHDVHAAYISHISHITSFALANTVLEKEKEEDAIFELASGGFESTVRLAKSNADMWVPILMQNRDNILDVLNEHISQLRKFKSCLEKENYDYLRELIYQANSIKKIIH